ncbi:MAG: hypothetical protein M3063_16285, partial [Actinomycetota bacterium]|nr:hypothetical protein [Actinomycetota bacterium]
MASRAKAPPASISGRLAGIADEHHPGLLCCGEGDQPVEGPGPHHPRLVQNDRRSGREGGFGSGHVREEPGEGGRRDAGAGLELGGGPGGEGGADHGDPRDLPGVPGGVEGERLARAGFADHADDPGPVFADTADEVGLLGRQLRTGVEGVADRGRSGDSPTRVGGPGGPGGDVSFESEEFDGGPAGLGAGLLAGGANATMSGRARTCPVKSWSWSRVAPSGWAWASSRTTLRRSKVDDWAVSPCGPTRPARRRSWSVGLRAGLPGGG